MRKRFLLTTLLSCTAVYGNTYIVKSGDTLSDILYENIPGRVYGKNGNLAKFLNMNPLIKDPNFLAVASVINLGTFKVIQAVDVPKQEATSKLTIHKNETSKKKSHKESRQSLSANFDFNYKSINAVEKSSNVNGVTNSDLGLGLSLRWKHKLSQKLSFVFDTTFHKYEFNVASNKTLTKPSQTKMYVGTGMTYAPSDRHEYSFSAGLRETFFLTTENNSTFEIDKVVIPSFDLSGKHALKKFKSGFSIDAIWNTGVLLPSSHASYSSELGTYWNLGAGSFFKLNESSYGISFLYGQKSVETGLIKQKTKDIAVGFNIGTDFY